MEREAGDEDRALLKLKKSECLTGIYLRLFPKQKKNKKTGLDASMEVFKCGLSYRSNSVRQNQKVTTLVVTYVTGIMCNYT